MGAIKAKFAKATKAQKMQIIADIRGVRMSKALGEMEALLLARHKSENGERPDPPCN